MKRTQLHRATPLLSRTRLRRRVRLNRLPTASEEYAIKRRMALQHSAMIDRDAPRRPRLYVRPQLFDWAEFDV
jgi:hypothetical protein